MSFPIVFANQSSPVPLAYLDQNFNAVTSSAGFDAEEPYGGGSIGAKLAQVLSVKDFPFGAVGDGVTDDTVAVQNCFDHAASIAAASVLSGVAIYFPGGSYKITAPLKVQESYIVLFGDGRLLSTIFVPTAFDILEFKKIDSSILYYPGMNGIGIRAASGANLATNSFVRLYNTTGFVACDMHMQGWYKGFELVGSARGCFDRVSLGQGGRTAGQGFSGFKIVGDATAGISTGNHITSLEAFSNTVVVGPYLHTLYVTGSDGLYIDQSHWTEGVNGLTVEPDNTTNNNVISSLIVSDTYMDACTGNNLQLIGSCASTGKYRDITFSGCIFRAGDLPMCQVGSTSALSKIKGLKFDACTFRMGQSAALVFTTDNVVGAIVSDNVFQDNNISANASGHDIVIRGEGVTVSGNKFLEGNATGKCVFAASTATKFSVYDNDFSASTRTTFIQNDAPAKAGYRIYDNVETTAYSVIDEIKSGTTTDAATPTTMWSITLNADEAVDIDVSVTGWNAGISLGTSVRLLSTYFKDGAAAPALLAADTSLRVAENDAGFTVSTAVSGDTVQVNVDGVAANTITWHAHVKGVVRGV